MLKSDKYAERVKNFMKSKYGERFIVDKATEIFTALDVYADGQKPTIPDGVDRAEMQDLVQAIDQFSKPKFGETEGSIDDNEIRVVAKAMPAACIKPSKAVEAVKHGYKPFVIGMVFCLLVVAILAATTGVFYQRSVDASAELQRWQQMAEKVNKLQGEALNLYEEAVNAPAEGDRRTKAAEARQKVDEAVAVIQSYNK